GKDVLSGHGGDDELHSGTGVGDSIGGDSDDDHLYLEGTSGIAEGGAGDDEIFGSASADRLMGDDGSDAISGQAGNDVVDAGPGDDSVHGDAGNDRLDAAEGTDSCSGGTGSDVCDGGDPGPQENTATDPDVCDDTAEKWVSCRKVGIPDRLEGLVRGTSEGRGARTTWTLRMSLERYGEQDGHVYYRIAEASGDWSVANAGNPCDLDGTGSFGPDVVALVDLDTTARTYRLDLWGPPGAETEWSCPDGQVFTGSSPLAEGGTVEGTPFDPRAMELTGAFDGTIEEVHQHFTWSFGPPAPARP
ncbi:MAG TPA: calcium-binding protein, partial [Nocardioides sp.]|nr:calcium-binding protein [Nocardioides sp.]